MIRPKSRPLAHVILFAFFFAVLFTCRLGFASPAKDVPDALQAPASKITVVLKNSPKQNVMATTITVDNGNDVGIRESVKQAIDLVTAYLKSKHAKIVGNPFVRVKKYSKNSSEFQVGRFVEKPIPASKTVAADIIPAAQVAFATHIGPYNTVKNSFVAVISWMAQNKKVQGGYPWEIFISNPKVTPEAKLQTDIYFPVL
jgi:effector-binding domain-containing protein